MVTKMYPFFNLLPPFQAQWFEPENFFSFIRVSSETTLPIFDFDILFLCSLENFMPRRMLLVFLLLIPNLFIHNRTVNREHLWIDAISAWDFFSIA